MVLREAGETLRHIGARVGETAEITTYKGGQLLGTIPPDRRDGHEPQAPMAKPSSNFTEKVLVRIAQRSRT